MDITFVKGKEEHDKYSIIFFRPQSCKTLILISPEKGIFSKSLLTIYSTYTFNTPAGEATSYDQSRKIFTTYNPILHLPTGMPDKAL